MTLEEEVTYDTLLRGKVKLIQPARGFRSSLDPLLLAAFAPPPYGRFLDIGCGTGAVSFLLLARDGAATGTGIEIQPRLAGLARRASGENGFGERYRVLEADARTAARTLRGASFDLVATNPPFRPLGTGVLPADGERSLANHEVALTLPEWLDIAARALVPEGRLVAIFPASRVADLLSGMGARGLAPARLRFVHPQEGQPAQRVLIEGRRGPARPVDVEAPLVVHRAGSFSDEVRAMVGEGIA